ncbi:iron-siderophore ABC transporter substrate-binding protein [Thalassospira sp. MCCC 1A01428]|uniref:iron-siderophore ABC transporter substrate-binding protein n=1 Tax=Thalassospira sp. MCCC 1A01428 TaxID=1470575 RepID=UPI000A1E5E17|nr:iron-siderophore ABC transporter substrate-binding protein [Thalassospira sp. MCCC 1A01428]OSQ43617.1 ferrichrome ABC transporter substrate-binding protein [Thalassospira sp. MCCC 1A01428]
MKKHWFSRVALGCVVTFAPFAALPATANTVTHELGQAEFDKPPTRFAVSNWALTESLLALGVDPVAIPEVDAYREWVVAPPLPEKFIDLGTRMEPNFEALRQSNPDAILISSDSVMAYDKFSTVAPTLVYSIYNSNDAAMDRAETLLRNLGKLTGKSEKAEDVIKQVNARIATAAERIRAVSSTDRKFAIVRIIDETNFRIHGNTSLFGSVLARMGFDNAWQGSVNSWSFHNGTVADLASMGDIELAYIEPVAPTIKAKLFQSPLWKTLPFVRHNQVYAIPSSWTFGSVLSGARFAEQFADAIVRNSKP